MRFHVKTYGCQMNERDSEAVSALLIRRGHRPAEGEEEADVVLVNTCSVRGKAEDKALGKLGLLVAGKAEHPGRRVGVMGCMVQRMQDRLFEKVPGLDFAVGTHRLHRLPAILDRVVAGEGPVLEAGESVGSDEELAEHLPADSRVSAFVNILLGCDRRCAYCVVPTVRGREWSRPAAHVLAEVRSLAEAGIQEVTLLGQSVMSYGRSNDVWSAGERSPLGFVEPLPRLLEAVSAVPGIRRIRFTSGHPSGCTDELARAMAVLDPVCEHLHLPLQSGSDRVLARMRRGYTAADYRMAARRLRTAVPGMALTTDIIVGFPGETEEDFEKTRALMAEIRFDNAFIFKYSPRPSTPAAEWKDDVPAAEKMRRNQILLQDQSVTSTAVLGGVVGAEVEVLVEGVSLRNPQRWSGRARRNVTVVFEPRPGVGPGTMVNVRVVRVTPQTLYGEVV